MRACDQIKQIAEFMSNDEVQESVLSMIDLLVERIPKESPSMRVMLDSKLAATGSTLQIIEVHARRRGSELSNMRNRKEYILRSQ